jgi:hypothetical protein
MRLVHDSYTGGICKGDAMTTGQSDIDKCSILKAEIFPAPVGGPRVLLRIEGILVTFACIVAFHLIHADWLMFAILFLVPDLSIVLYLAGPRVGSAGYNIAHSYVAPIGLVIGSQLLGWRLGEALFLVWAAHIGFDRALGYGLKYASAFSDTHLGQIGRAAAVAN